MEFDVLIRGGIVYDGRGGLPRKGDVGISGGFISAIGALDTAVGRVQLDAAGLVVAPGFIDTHTHSDVAMSLADRHDALRAAPLLQGVTTEICGNCGFSPFPFVPERREDLTMQGTVVFGEVQERWPSIADYRDAVAQKRLLCNLAPLIGHGALRAGTNGSERAIDPTQLVAMERALSNALANGAFGLSTGLIYAPGVFAGRDELIHLARTAARSGRPYVSHIRSETAFLMDAVDEAIDIGRRSGASVHISHHKAAGRENWGRTADTLQRIDDARATGVDVWLDVYPYVLGSTLLTALLPSWVHEGGMNALLARLADIAVRHRIEQDFAHQGWENLVRASDWSGISIASCPATPTSRGEASQSWPIVEIFLHPSSSSIFLSNSAEP